MILMILSLGKGSEQPFIRARAKFLERLRGFRVWESGVRNRAFGSQFEPGAAFGCLVWCCGYPLHNSRHHGGSPHTPRCRGANFASR